MAPLALLLLAGLVGTVKADAPSLNADGCYSTGCSAGGCPAFFWELNRNYCFWQAVWEERCCPSVNCGAPPSQVGWVFPTTCKTFYTWEAISICTPTCAPGYTGSPSATCLSSGQWSFGGTCTPILASPLPSSRPSPSPSPPRPVRPGYYPRGVQYNVPVTTVTNGNWVLCYDMPYSHATSLADMNACRGGTHILMAAKSSSASPSFTLLAAGATNMALAQTSSLTSARLENGAYWYYYPGLSTGFAAVNVINLNQADVQTSSCASRLSWHLARNIGGYRAGCTINLNVASTWRKLVYRSTGPLYHGWVSPIAGCSTLGYDMTGPTPLGGAYPYYQTDSPACRAWKLAATVCNQQPIMYVDANNWQCASSGGFTDPVFGTYCASSSAPQYSCSTCPGFCNAGTCRLNARNTLRNCAGVETSVLPTGAIAVANEGSYPSPVNHSSAQPANFTTSPATVSPRSPSVAAPTLGATERMLLDHADRPDVTVVAHEGSQQLVVCLGLIVMGMAAVVLAISFRRRPAVEMSALEMDLVESPDSAFADEVEPVADNDAEITIM